MLRRWLIICLCVPWAHGGPDPLARAERELRSNRPARAAAAFERHLEAAPGDPEARIGLARAWSRMGRCEQALQLLEGSPEHGAAVVEAACLLRRGRVSEARAAYREALVLDPEQTEALVGAALAASAAGDEDAVGALRSEIVLTSRGDLLDALVGAQWAYDRGSEALDAHLADLFRLLRGGPGVRHATLRARRWLDLDDPAAAARELAEASRRGPPSATLLLWEAEAQRRLGHPVAGLKLLERPVARRLADELHARAVEARLRADIGDFEGARRGLAPVRGSLDPELIASAWYVAQRSGDTAEARRHARRWERSVRGLRGSLDHLLPVDLREAP